MNGMKVCVCVCVGGGGGGGGGLGGYSHIWAIRGCATQQGMVFASESGTGSTNQRFCLELGILFAILTLEHSQGYSFAARIALKMNIVAVHSNAVSDSKVNRISYFSVWNRDLFSCFCLEQGSKSVSLVWNRVRFPGTQRHTPILNCED